LVQDAKFRKPLVPNTTQRSRSVGGVLTNGQQISFTTRLLHSQVVELMTSARGFRPLRCWTRTSYEL